MEMTAAAMAFESRILLRRLIRSPGYAVPVILIVALGSAALACVSAFVAGGLLNAFPYPQPERIAYVYGQRADDGVERWRLSGPEFAAARDSGAFAEFAGFGGGSYNLAGEGFTQRVRGLAVTPNFFRVFAVEPVLGRAFDAGDAGRDDLVVVGERFFRRELGGDPDRLGTPLVLNGSARILVGVMPERFRFIGSELFVLSGAEPATRPADRHVYFGIGRLPEGGAAAARGALAAPLQALAPEWQFLTRPITDNLQRAAPSLWSLAAAVLVLMALIVTNLGGLQLARFERRRGDIAVMMATGATSARVARRWLAETAVLFLVGAGLGVAAAAWAIERLLALVPARAGGMEILPPEAVIALDWPVIALTVGSALAASVLVALLPTLRARRIDVPLSLRGARGTDRSRTYGALVFAQLAVTTALVAFTALIVQSHAALQARSLGFEPDDVQTFQLALPAADYPDAGARIRFYAQVTARLTNEPGVSDAGGAHLLPLEGFERRMDFALAGRPLSALYNEIMPGYLETLRVPLVQGRRFDAGDAADAAQVALVNQRFAEQHLASDALGRTLVDGEGVARRVVGVVGDMRQHSIGAPIEPEVLLPFAQVASPSSWWAIVVRGKVSIDQLRGAVAAVDPAVPVFAVRPLAEVVQAGFGVYRLTQTLLILFGVIAVLLAWIGVYGLLAQFVSQRRRELGVRAAVGATRARLSWLVLRRCAPLLAGGAVTGLLASLAAERAAGALLVEVGTLQPAVLLTVVATLVLVAVVAATPAVLRVVRLDPTEALRQE